MLVTEGSILGVAAVVDDMSQSSERERLALRGDDPFPLSNINVLLLVHNDCDILPL